MLCTLYTIAVSGQECTDTVGSLSHDNHLVTLDQTFMGYAVPCDGTVVAWEFCYQRIAATVTFYPGIWKITETISDDTHYTLVQSNNVTYDQNVHDPQDPNNAARGCQFFNLSDTDQFTAPAGSVVGLYSGTHQTQLLHTNTDNSIRTYNFSGNQSSVTVTGNINVAHMTLNQPITHICSWLPSAK